MAFLSSVRRARVTHLAHALLFAVVAFLVVPFSRSERRVFVPPDHELDAIEEALLIDRGVTTLETRPFTYYDTDVLYPDRHQIRGTEPLLGFALIGVPLKGLLGLDQARLFETLRWLTVCASLVYACLWLQLLGAGLELATAGAVLCVMQPVLLGGIERLQVLSMPLVLSVLYHAARVARGDGARHAIALFAWTALYPLFGMINALMLVVAVALVLPAIARGMFAVSSSGGFQRVAVIVLLAAATDVALTAPWLLDRSDMSVYVSNAFLQIKHWQPQILPQHLADLTGFATRSLGAGLLIAVGVLVHLLIARRLREFTASSPGSLAMVAAVTTVCLAAGAGLLIVVSASGISWWRLIPWLAPAALVWFYFRQYRDMGLHTRSGLSVARFGAGLGLLLCAVSFGPVYASNAAGTATYLDNGLLALLPPLKSLREFSRFWLFGMCCLSISVALWIGLIMQARSQRLRLLVATAIFAAALTSLVQRPLVLSDRIEAPGDFLALASRSTRAGAIYVHPYMKWNTLSGVWMIPASAALNRPIVNGYLGIEPPWFIYASRVLNRFPDAEASWLLRTWHVDTVISLVGALGGVDETVARETLRDGSGVIYEMNGDPTPAIHPSAGTCSDLNGAAGLDVQVPRIDVLNDGLTHVVLTALEGFESTGVEMRFTPSVTAEIPPSVDAYVNKNGAHTRVNDGMSGRWLESLAADALLHRRAPTMLLRLERPTSEPVEIVFHGAAAPPLEHVTLCGRWLQAGTGGNGH